MVYKQKFQVEHFFNSDPDRLEASVNALLSEVKGLLTLYSIVFYPSVAKDGFVVHHCFITITQKV